MGLNPTPCHVANAGFGAAPQGVGNDQREAQADRPEYVFHFGFAELKSYILWPYIRYKKGIAANPHGYGLLFSGSVKRSITIRYTVYQKTACF